MPHLFVTGGAGFIGSHTVRRFLDRGWTVTVLDNLSRIGTELNLEWIRSHPASGRFTFVEGDVRDYEALIPHAASADAILHAAGQTAVTKSVANPRHDFESNAVGTFNMLEAIRETQSATHNPLLIYTSTNKVYGEMESVGTHLAQDRYEYIGLPEGVSESQPVDFHSPYGCSKGTGDQYVRDYARIYGLRTVVFRQSCIYGVWQFGVEDQGWLAYFALAAVLDLPLTIFGDGMQVRDVLYIDDLVSAYEAAVDRVDAISGQIFNIGGGPARAITLLDLIAMLESHRGSPMDVSYADWRPGDQRVYVSDVSKASQLLGWEPTIDAQSGVHRLFEWAQANRDLLMRARAQLAERARLSEQAISG
jgi:CDP-paratose 2-epimerase